MPCSNGLTEDPGKVSGYRNPADDQQALPFAKGAPCYLPMILDQEVVCKLFGGQFPRPLLKEKEVRWRKKARVMESDCSPLN